ncbi:hypothetical protein OE766_15410 [Pararhizobium sp. YC-54]|uniref:tetratricopeptide repeat protein n=1 Tax=Pararhizobium sp. YC-54 TaxID=2986920 RepID=UPI0021F7B10C|nr:hypothetical protein [Pararhizobium sp. YC-54]MCV9999630.1 hypothetical protein [Pararhizobium sp. YC-54]
MPTELPNENIQVRSGPSPAPECVTEELDRILESAAFKATPRRKKLLRYLVDETLAGRGRELKGYTIATLVFGRDDSFDPQTDPVVRLEARRLRHDLDGYYVSAGRSNPLRISIPKGQYAPVVEQPDAAGASSAQMPATEAPAAGDLKDLVFQAAPPFRRAILAALAVIALFVGVIVYAHVRSDMEAADGSRDENGASLVVLPFEANGDNSKNALLADGMADEIMASINRFGSVRLYLPSAKEKNLAGPDPIEIGRDLNLSYVVSGTVELDDGDQSLRVTARLIDVQTQRILWIGSYERDYTASSLRSVQQEIANAIASALGQPYGVLRNADTGRITDPTAMSSYECVLQAYTYRWSLTLALHTPVLACLEEAVQRDPHYVDAWAMRAWLYMDEGRFGWSKEGAPEPAYRRAISTARHALALDRNNVPALKALSSTLHYMGDYAESERVQRQALALNPNDPDTLAQLGWRLAVRGNFDEGIPFLKRAIERSVNPPGWYYHLIAIDLYLRGDYEETLAAAQRSTIDGSGISWSLVAIAEGALDQKDEAHAALVKMAEKSPLLARDPAAAYRRHQAIDLIVDALVSGLRKAGLDASIATTNPA